MRRVCPELARALAALLLFGVSFGYVEAAVVVYIRMIVDPIRHKLHPDAPSSALFPVLRLDEIEAELPDTRRALRMELARELATMLMLASAGLAVGRNPRQVFAAFLVAFGVWDIAFYASLRVLIDWPETLLTWDLLFLLPVPWTGPVIAPMIVAASMIATGATVLARELAVRPFRMSWADWALVAAGGAVVVVAFCWDYRNIVAGGLPRPFHWSLFAAGEAIGLAGFLRAVVRDRASS
jgi:hypothetical protein